MPRKAKVSEKPTVVRRKRHYTRRNPQVKRTGADADAQLSAITALTGLSSVNSEQRLKMIRKIVS